MKKLIEDIKKDEGFVGTVYIDSLGFPTVGFGTKLPISKFEANMLLENRLKKMIKKLEKKQPILNTLPLEAQSIIANMSYQMGVSGVMKFKKMWGALSNQDYVLASKEMLNSKWAKQTPKRAKRLAKRMRNV